MRILVTGSSGFVGKYRTEQLIKQGHEVIALNFRGHNKPVLHEYQIDITNSLELFNIVGRHRPDRIEHYASQSVVTTALLDPYNTFATNVMGAVNVLECSSKFKIPEVLIMTSDKYYGNLENAKEDDRPLITQGTYETSKLLQDELSQSYQRKGLNVTIIRSANIFGPNDPNKRIVPNTISTLKNNERPVIFKYFKGLRQYIYLSDFNDAVDLILKQNEKNKIYNIGTDTILGQSEVVHTITDIWNDKYKTSLWPISKDMDTKVQEIEAQFLNWNKLKSIGFEPQYTFEEGIEEMI